MHSKGNIIQHDHHVCHGNPRKENVDGVGLHVLVGQHQYVHDVEDDSQYADSQGKISMQWFVKGLQKNEILFCSCTCLKTNKFIPLIRLTT